MCARIKSILDQINGEIEENVGTFENLLNNQISPVENYESHLREEILIGKETVRKLEDEYHKVYNGIILKNYTVYKKLLLKKYDFINYEELNFDLSYIKEQDYDLKSTINRLDSLIERENILEILIAIRYTNCICRVKEIESRKLSHRFVGGIRGFIAFIKKILYYFDIILVVLVSFVIGFYVYRDCFLINVLADSQQTIALSIVGALTSLLGFLVVFLQLSYDNLNKTFGVYAKRFLFNTDWKYLSTLFILDLTLLLISASLKNGNYTIRNEIFNLSIIFFFTFIIQTGFKIKSIIDRSISTKYLNDIINKISIHEIQQNADYDNRQRVDVTLHTVQSNPLYIVGEINRIAISQRSDSTSVLIISQLTDAFNRVLFSVEAESKNIDSKKEFELILNSYCNYIKSVVSLCYRNQSDSIVYDVYRSIDAVTFSVVVLELKGNLVEKVFQLIGDVVKESIEYNKYNEAKYGFQLFQKLTMYYIQYSPLIEVKTKNKNGSYTYYNMMFYSSIYNIATYEFNMLLVDSLNKITGKSKGLILDFLLIYSRTIGMHFNTKFEYERKKEIIEYFSSTIVSMYSDYLKEIQGINIYVQNPFKNLVRDVSFLDEIAYSIFTGWISWYTLLFDKKFFPENHNIGFEDIMSLILDTVTKRRTDHKTMIMCNTLRLYVVIYDSYSSTGNVLIRRAKWEIENICKELSKRNDEDETALMFAEKIKEMYKTVKVNEF
ncbi:hypothetical protein [uncultured Spirosoma sp.]|uniref:hypothetical protein n=1 Tax=uncultured Spirosoma sp. TaxID=278208 RepID=UPI0025893032|nr:hypothetical protein [uncultured Spirosoma sp.]